MIESVAFPLCWCGRPIGPHAHTVPEYVGRGRYFQNVGQSYAEMLAGVGPILAGGMVTGLAAYLGLSVRGAVAIGLSIIGGRILLAMGFGYVVWRYRIIHATLDHEYKNNPFNARQLDLLEAIERNTRK